MAFTTFRGIKWPVDATLLLTVSVADVQAWRDLMVEDDKAPKTINRRVSSLSSFYKYLHGVAAELRLPITTFGITNFRELLKLVPVGLRSIRAGKLPPIFHKKIPGVADVQRIFAKTASKR